MYLVIYYDDNFRTFYKLYKNLNITILENNELGRYRLNNKKFMNYEEIEIEYYNQLKNRLISRSKKQKKINFLKKILKILNGI